MSYPPIEPYKSGLLRVSDIHSLYYEVCGNPSGRSIVFLHGGPGGSVRPPDRQFFNPEKYNIVLFTQRGAQKSIPKASLVDNTTWDLVADLEKLREYLSIEKWHVFGGSWGSTLALAYAQTHPERVTALILRGIFTVRQSELEFFYGGGAGKLFPEAYEEFVSHVPESERGDIIRAYHPLLTSDNRQVRLEAAKRWAAWEDTTATLLPLSRKTELTENEEENTMAFARIENHYFINKGWLREGQLLEKSEIDKIRHIPCIAINGRYDVICPVTTAYDLKKAWPELTLKIVPDAGHASREPHTTEALIEATDAFAEL